MMLVSLFHKINLQAVFIVVFLLYSQSTAETVVMMIKRQKWHSGGGVGVVKGFAV